MNPTEREPTHAESGVTAGDAVPSPASEADSGPSSPDAAIQEFAQQVQAALEGWSVRMTGAVLAGRSATTVARMATARATAELRRFSLPPGTAGETPSEAREAAGELLRRGKAVLDRAAHQIERNRYSLQEMQAELDRLKPIYRRIVPEPAEPDADQADSESGNGES